MHNVYNIKAPVYNYKPGIIKHHKYGENINTGKAFQIFNFFCFVNVLWLFLSNFFIEMYFLHFYLA